MVVDEGSEIEGDDDLSTDPYSNLKFGLITNCLMARTRSRYGPYTAIQPTSTFSSMRAATGRQLKQSVKVFHSLMLYRRLHSS